MGLLQNPPGVLIIWPDVLSWANLGEIFKFSKGRGTPGLAPTVHGIFDRTVKKSEKLQKSVQKNRNINKKRKTEMRFTIRAHRT